MDDISRWRDYIGEIDAKLVELFNKRAQYALEIGRIKMGKGMEIYNPNREKEVINHACSRNKGPLENSSIEKIFKQIISECRLIEKTE